MQQNAAKSRPDTALWIKLALGVSLAVNLLIAGVFIGSSLNKPGREMVGGQVQGRPVARALRELGLGPFIAAFPPELRRQMREDLRAQVLSRPADRAALVAEVNQMLVLLRAQPFDRDAFSAVLEGQKQRFADRADAGRQVIVAAISTMTPRQRAEFADGVERAIRAAQARTAARTAPTQPAGQPLP